MGRLFSPGKLLLTSEYAVLDGALALAVPTKPGQAFFYEEIPRGSSRILWRAYHQDYLWLEANIDYKNWKVEATNNPEASAFILKVLKKLQQLSKSKLQHTDDYRLKTNLEFPSNYGLGSSSTLMNNLAEWAGVDAFVLNGETLGGSGYDIAVAQQKRPLLYQISDAGRTITSVDFNPDFKEGLLFIHLNQKQNSREGIQLYRSKHKSDALIDAFTSITGKVLAAKDLDSFSELMAEHEQLLSEFLGLKTAKELHFRDCPSFIKSLGAWGGDFVMAAKFEGCQNYFGARGFSSVFTWDQLIRS